MSHGKFHFIGNLQHKASGSSTPWRREARKPKSCYNFHTWRSSSNSWYEPGRPSSSNMTNSSHAYSYGVRFTRIIIWKRHWRWEIFFKNFLIPKHESHLQFWVWESTYLLEGQIYCFDQLIVNYSYHTNTVKRIRLMKLDLYEVITKNRLVSICHNLSAGLNHWRETSVQIFKWLTDRSYIVIEFIIVIWVLGTV